VIAAELVTLGVEFYDAMRSQQLDDHGSRHAAVFYMRRKDADVGDAMPYYEALAAALADRAAARIRGAETLAQLAPRGNA
jgi:hypothetical protein